MLDIHSHILFSTDDGAQTIADSQRLLEKAVSENISDIIATPHFDPKYKPSRESILGKVATLNDLAKSNDLPITIYPGQEVRIYEDLIIDVRDNKLLTLNDANRYMLIEFPKSHAPTYATRIFYEMQLLGITPILVHPERNDEIMAKPQLADQYVNAGVLLQITTGSVLGKFGRKAKKSAFKLLSDNLVTFIASDAHNLDTRDFNYLTAQKKLNKVLGTHQTLTLFNNAQSLIFTQP